MRFCKMVTSNQTVPSTKVAEIRGRNEEASYSKTAFVKVFLWVIAINYLYWVLPFQIYGQEILENSLPYDSYRYITAAVMVLRGEGIHPELVANPIPVLWAYFWLHFGYFSLLGAQAAIYTLASAYFVKSIRRCSLPGWMANVSVCNPILATYVGAPSKEFFVLVSMMLTLGWLLKRTKHGQLETAIAVFANLVSSEVRPANLLFVAIAVITIRFSKHLKSLLLCIFAAISFTPRNYDFIAQLNAETPSSSPLMQAFRELCSRPGFYAQCLTSPMRFLFYIIYPAPYINVFKFLVQTQDLNWTTYNCRASVEAMGFLIYGITAIAALRYRRRNSGVNERAVRTAGWLASYYFAALAALAIVEPFPHARYRIIALFGLPFVFYFLADKRESRRSGLNSLGDEGNSVCSPQSLFC